MTTSRLSLNGDDLSHLNAPPNDEDAEKFVLGALIASAEDAFPLIEELQPEDFYREIHARLFELLQTMRAEGQPIEPQAVAIEVEACEWYQSLRRDATDHAVLFVADLVKDAPHALSIDYYAGVVAEKARRRKLIDAGFRLVVAARDPQRDIDELRDLIDPRLFEVESTRERFPLLTAAELRDTSDDLEYLVDGVLVKGQPGGIFGSKKTLKTNIAIDLALSLAQTAEDDFGNVSGGLFLGRFKVPRPVRVALLSGESGRGTIAETARRIGRSKGWHDLGDFNGVLFGFDLPRFGEPGDLAALRRLIRRQALEVLILDPVYLCMNLGTDAGNLFAVGQKLVGLTQIGQELGCTVLIAHHTKQGAARVFEPPELDDIAWAGFQEWARQWVLLGRREKYDPDSGGHHELWMNVGGSAGHSATWAVNITEGTRQDDGGRHWDVDVIPAAQARARAAEERDETKEQAADERARARVEKNKAVVLEGLAKFPDGETAKVIAAACGRNEGLTKDILDVLVAEGKAQPCPVQKRNRKEPYPGYKPVYATNATNATNPIDRIAPP